MKKMISLILVSVITLGFSINCYAISSEAPHIYYKYTVREWWDKDTNNGLYDKKPIYKNKLEKVTPQYGTQISILDGSRMSGYRDYEFVPVMINGYLSYETRGVSLFTLNVGSEYLRVGRGYADKDGNIAYGYTKDVLLKVEPYLDFPNKWAFTTQELERYVLKINYYIYEHKDKDIFISEIIASKDAYPANGLHTDGYWYVNMGVLNEIPELNVIEPIANYRVGNQDAVIVSGEVKDADIGNILDVRYNLETIRDQNITLTQPTNIISSGQWQAFRGYIQLQGLKTGTSLLELWTEDNQGGKSKTVEIPIVIFSTLENILDALKKYTIKAGEPQFMIINSNSRIVQNIENDRLIEQIKKELYSKNIKLFFSGKDGETEAYISSKLLN